MRVIILAKTKMRRGLCIGAANYDTGEPIRLLPKNESFWPIETPLCVGGVYEMLVVKKQKNRPPHTEDYEVEALGVELGNEHDLEKWIADNCYISEGLRGSIFDNQLHFTGNGKGYLPNKDVSNLNHSVCFVRLQFPLDWYGQLSPPEKKKIFYRTGKQDNSLFDSLHIIIPEGNEYLDVKYVGMELPVKLPAGTILRFSLARWWEPPGGYSSRELAGMGELCWLQLSGWYTNRRR